MIAVAVAAASGQEAGATINRATLRRVKGNGRLLPALRALHGHLYSLAHAGRLRRGNRGEPLILGLLTGLTSFGFVFEPFVVEENLFAGSPDEHLAAIHALDTAILEVGLGGSPFSLDLIFLLYLLHSVCPLFEVSA